MTRIVKKYKGAILFYLLIIGLIFMISTRNNHVNVVASNNNQNQIAMSD